MDIPDHLFPKLMRRHLASGNIDQNMRNKFIRNLVDHMMRFSENPDKRSCGKIAKRLVAMHPNTFETRLDDGERLGTGYGGLAGMIRRRVENATRNNKSARIRLPRTTSNVANAANSNSKPRSSLSIRYGCVSWQPEAPPDNETEETQEEKRKELSEMFDREGYSPNNVRRVEELLTATYFQQRCDLNNINDMEIIKEKWPLLFQTRWLLDHFKTLTGL